MPVPIELRQLKVTSLDVDFHEVSWELKPTTMDVLDFQFQVRRSESVEGPFDELTPPFEDRYSFVDNIVQILHRWREYQYIIRVIEKTTGDYKDFGPVSHEPEPDIVAIELRRHIRILFQEFAGRRCIVLPVRTFGQRCPECWNPTLEKVTKSGCLTCFAPGTLVRTEFGWRPIEKIGVGHLVLSSDGSFQRVTNVVASQYYGEMRAIRASVSATELLVTPTHPFYMLRGAHSVKRGCGPKCTTYIERHDGVIHNGSIRKLPSGNYWARAQVDAEEGRTTLGTFSTEEAAAQAITEYQLQYVVPSHLITWDLAESIVQDDYLVVQWPREAHDVETIDVPIQFRQKTTRAKKRLGITSFIVDIEFLWMIGMYLAEGSSGSRCIVFSLHKDEIQFQERLLRFFVKCGYHPFIQSKSENGVNVVVSSTTLAAWFHSWLGANCYSKQIPDEFMYLPPDKAWALLLGVYDGDGCKKANSITQTSEVLALQLVELLHRAGEQPLVRHQQSSVLTPIGNKRRLAYGVSWAEPGLTHAYRKYRWEFGGEALAQVRSVETRIYSGTVYNLEVEGNHTYVAQGVVVHNCYNTGFNRGYMHPIEAYVQIDPSTKSQQHNNPGEMQQDNTTMRMGYYPSIKPHDLIIEGENIRWRVEEQTQTEHSRAAVHQEVKLHRVPEKDIEYAIPVHFNKALKNLFLTPARNYTNPTNLSNFEENEIPSIFGLYPSQCKVT